MNEEFVMWGGYGGHNLGDEAILWAMSRLLRKLSPGSIQNVFVRSELSTQVAEQYKRWDITPVRFGSWASLKVLSRARLIVGGGQLLDDTLSLWPVGWTSLVLIANAIFRKRPLILCIGAETVHRKITRIVAKGSYSLARVCSCRDPESLEAVRELGLPTGKIVATRDVVFSTKRGLLPSRQRKVTSVARIALVVAHDPQRTPSKANFFSELGREVADLGCEVCFVAHDLRMEYDYGLLLDLEREYANDPRVTTSRPMLVDEVLQVYADCDAVISSRMHPLILASLVGTLPIAILGTAKVQSLVNALGLPVVSRADSSASRGKKISSFLSDKLSYLQAIEASMAGFGPIVEATTAQALVI
jgi:polysaccharide pyruvyl transferase WcaK-like protein